MSRVVRRRSLTPAILPVLLAAATDAAPSDAAADLLAEADALYARRAEGARGGTALPGTADAAVAAHRRALAVAPDSARARARLLRALFFRASFCGASRDERKRLYDEARQVAEKGLAPLEARVGPARRADRLARLRAVPDAAELHFWAAVVWGEWALAKGTFAAARQGAAGRIRDLAQTVLDLDPDLEQGGGHRILGRLHARSPRIPFFTLWISRDEALDQLRRSLDKGSENTVTQLFLAEAILDHAPARKEEARRLLERCAASVPRPDYLVEDAHYAALARERLAALR